MIIHTFGWKHLLTRQAFEIHDIYVSTSLKIPAALCSTGADKANFFLILHGSQTYMNSIIAQYIWNCQQQL